MATSATANSSPVTQTADANQSWTSRRHHGGRASQAAVTTRRMGCSIILSMIRPPPRCEP
jgi:hypothetical protein